MRDQKVNIQAPCERPRDLYFTRFQQAFPLGDGYCFRSVYSVLLRLCVNTTYINRCMRLELQTGPPLSRFLALRLVFGRDFASFCAQHGVQACATPHSCARRPRQCWESLMAAMMAIHTPCIGYRRNHMNCVSIHVAACVQ